MKNKEQIKYGYIYITTNLVNNRKYIGQHKAKKFEPNKYLGSGVYFEKAVKKYGKENFKCELLEWCESPENLNEREIYWIRYYKAVENDIFYNVSLGGNIPNPKGTHLKKVICIETQQIFDSIKEASAFANNSDVTNYLIGNQKTAGGYHFAYLDDLEKQNKLKHLIGKPPTLGYNYIKYKNISIICIETQIIYKIEDIKLKFNGVSWNNIRDCCSRKQHTDYGYHWAYLDDLQRQEELKEFIGKEPNFRFEKLKEKGRLGKSIKCLETGKIFKSITEAQRWLGKGFIAGVISGEQKTAGGYHWELI